MQCTEEVPYSAFNCDVILYTTVMLYYQHAVCFHLCIKYFVCEVYDVTTAKRRSQRLLKYRSTLCLYFGDNMFTSCRSIAVNGRFLQISKDQEVRCNLC